MLLTSEFAKPFSCSAANLSCACVTLKMLITGGGGYLQNGLSSILYKFCTFQKSWKKNL